MMNATITVFALFFCEARIVLLILYQSPGRTVLDTLPTFYAFVFMKVNPELQMLSHKLVGIVQNTIELEPRNPCLNGIEFKCIDKA